MKKGTETGQRTVQSSWSLCRQSFGDVGTRKTIYLVLFELLFFFLLMVSIAAYGRVMMKLAENVSTDGMDKLEQLLKNPDDADKIGFDPGVLTRFMVNVVIVTALLIVAVILWLAFTRSLVWAKLLELPYTLQLFKRFFYLHLLWVPVFSIVSAAVLVGLNSVAPFVLHPNLLAASLFFLMFLIAYFGQFLYFVFSTQKGHVFSLFGRAIVQGITQINRFIVSSLLAIAVFFITGFIDILLFRFFPPTAARVIQLALVLLLITWFRYFAARILHAAAED